jgi:RHS repeat-associated protein
MRRCRPNQVRCPFRLPGWYPRSRRLVPKVRCAIDGSPLFSHHNLNALYRSPADDSLDYLPFGEQTTGSAWNLTFTGKESDATTSLYNFLARYDSSALGRFMSPDPSGIDLAELGDPQQLNLYSYVRNNPLTLTDPYGLDCVYLNDGGNGVESIDRNSSAGECGDNGGYWVDQTANANSFHDTGSGFATMKNTNGTSYLFCTGGDCSQPPPFSMGGPPPNDAISKDPLFDGALLGALGGAPSLLRGAGALLGDLFGTGARAATAAATETTAEETAAEGTQIIFKHGFRHLVGRGLDQAAVENAIRADIPKVIAKCVHDWKLLGKSGCWRTGNFLSGLYAA